ncbi:MAG: GNAT family N-acetyltransferase [Bacteroidota bacterium]
MEYAIRDARREDLPDVMRLIRELAEFERELDEVETSVAELERDGFGESPAFHCFIAESSGEVIGIALVYWRYSTWKGKTLHLEDLIVTQSVRGKGIGNALLAEVVRYGKAHGCRRIQWEVLDWNENAIRFYQSKGALILRDWHLVHLRKDAIQAYPLD